jgi:uncharacterized protein DUF3618
MDEGQRQEGAAVSSTAAGEGSRSPEEIRVDIEQTREEVGETVEALAAKTDVKAQARQRAEAIKANAKAKADELKAKAQSRTPDEAREGGRQAIAKIRENPAPLAAGVALIAAFLLGRSSARR